MADSILRLRVEDKEYNASLKQARQGLLHLQQALQQSGATFQNVDKAAVEYARGLGRMETVAKTAKGRIGEMTSAFTDLRMQYKQLSDAEKNSPFGKAMNQSLNELRGRIQETKKQMSDVDNELNDFSGAIGELGSKLGVSSELMGLLTTGTMGYAAAIGAGVTAVVAATKAWAEYNSELAKQSQITSVTTGLSGEEGGAMTDFARSVANTYGVDFREVINTANILMQQFGKSGQEAMQLIRDGMQGMINGDGPKMLSMVQQFAPAFLDAGLSASQLLAVVQNSEGGLFSEQNMNAILMGIKNIRLMTNNTSEALAKLGIDGKEMTRKMNEGSMSVFDALQQVATAIENTSSSSQAAGEVMQYVFGRQGAMQGMKLGRAIATLNLNLEETKLQTGEVGQAFYDLQIANENLEKAMRDCFGYNGWEEMAISLKGSFYNALTNTLEVINQTRDMIDRVYSAIENVGNSNGFIKLLNKVLEANLGVVGLYRSISSLFGSSTAPSGGGILGKLQSGVGTVQSSRDVVHGGSYTVTSSGGRIISAVHRGADGTVIDYTGRTGGNVAASSKSKSRGGRGGGSGSSKTTPQQKAADMVAKAERTYAETMQKETLRLESGIDDQLAAKKKELSAQERLFDAYNDAYATYKDPKYKDEISKTANNIKELGKEIKGMEDAVKQAKVKVEMAQGLSGFNAQTMNAWMQGRQGDLSKAEYGSAEYSNIQGNIADMNAIKTILEQSMTAGIDAAQLDLEPLWEKVFDGDNIPDETWQSLIDIINEKLKELNIEPIQIDFQTGTIKKQAKEMKTDWQAAASAIQAVGSAMTAIEDPAAKVLGTIAQAVATMALSYSQASLATSNEGWGWIAFAATGLATMLSSIAAIKSATKGFANGGIVPGGSYSGDNLRTSDYGVNSGELILNRAQQDNIAAQLQGGGMQNLNLTATVTGEQIRLALNNTGRRTGNGEYLKFK